jgi:hypothetical protein
VGVTADPLRDPDTLERIFHAAVRDSDVEGVGAALRLLAVVDPRRAERLHGALRYALAERRREEAREDGASG